MGAGPPSEVMEFAASHVAEATKQNIGPAQTPLLLMAELIAMAPQQSLQNAILALAVSYKWHVKPNN